MSLETDIRTRDALQSALILIQQAESEMRRVESYAQDSKLRHFSQDSQGTLVILRELGNHYRQQLDDIIDPS